MMMMMTMYLQRSILSTHYQRWQRLTQSDNEICYSWCHVN